VAGSSGLRIDHYDWGASDWSGGREAMVRFGPAAGVTVVAVLPLFEEGNRTRAAMVDVLRRLAELGIGGALPDLPGVGESLIATRDATLAMWRAAFAAACASLAGTVHVMGWRGGALVDGAADVASRWYLAPLSGTSVVRELERLRHAGGGEDFGGNLLSAAMLDGLAGAEPVTAGALRVVRLESDPKAADRKIAGVPLWRGSEPGVDAGLQAAVAADVAAWVER
jgi:hypothetical protein